MEKKGATLLLLSPHKNSPPAAPSKKAMATAEDARAMIERRAKTYGDRWNEVKSREHLPTKYSFGKALGASLSAIHDHVLATAQLPPDTLGGLTKAAANRHKDRLIDWWANGDVDVHTAISGAVDAVFANMQMTTVHKLKAQGPEGTAFLAKKKQSSAQSRELMKTLGKKRQRKPLNDDQKKRRALANRKYRSKIKANKENT